MRKKKVKIKYKNLVLFGIVLVFIILGVTKIFFKDVKIQRPEVDFKGKSLEEVIAYCEEYVLELEKVYEYSNQVLKDIIIDYQITGDKLKVTISNGEVPHDLYREHEVNELGNIPIMMYHGIVDTQDNQYTGGNVDKDGYNRTAKAFREDLDFYYQSGYRMISLKDYVKGKIDVPLGYSPIVLTFDDGNQNNFNVLDRDDDGNLIIDPNCAIGILEEFKKKYSDFGVTATFFVMDDLFNQKEYNEEILIWLVEHGYDVGNHTTTHPDFTKINSTKTQEVVGKMYKKLEDILKDKYVKIIALPFGSPYKTSHANFPYILKGTYDGYSYETEALLRVGWDSEVSPFNKNFNKQFLKRCRAYDNNGKEFDIKAVFKSLENKRYISDGDIDTIVIKKGTETKLKENYTNIIVYEE